MCEFTRVYYAPSRLYLDVSFSNFYTSTPQIHAKGITNSLQTLIFSRKGRSILEQTAGVVARPKEQRSAIVRTLFIRSPPICFGNGPTLVWVSRERRHSMLPRKSVECGPTLELRAHNSTFSWERGKTELTGFYHRWDSSLGLFASLRNQAHTRRGQ